MKYLNDICGFIYRLIQIISLFFSQHTQLKKMNRIKLVLEEQGRSQRWLADKLGKSYTMINSYVQNRNQPRLEILYEMAELLDVDVKDLLVSNKDDN